jgi:hypothetical protein
LRAWPVEYSVDAPSDVLDSQRWYEVKLVGLGQQFSQRISEAIDRTGIAAVAPHALFAASLLAFAGLVVSQTANRPAVRAGDRWSFAAYYTVPTTAPNRVWKVLAVSEEGIKGTEDGLPLHLTHDLNVVESPRVRESNPRLLYFPLAVGKEWQFESNWEFKPKGSKGTYLVAVRVMSYERVSVPAGEFYAFKLTARETLGGTSPIGTNYAGEATRTYWYAPEARAVVKSVSHNPYLGSATVELVGMELRP